MKIDRISFFPGNSFWHCWHSFYSRRIYSQNRSAHEHIHTWIRLKENNQKKRQRNNENNIVNECRTQNQNTFDKWIFCLSFVILLLHVGCVPLHWSDWKWAQKIQHKKNALSAKASFETPKTPCQSTDIGVNEQKKLKNSKNAWTSGNSFCFLCDSKAICISIWKKNLVGN